MSVLTESPIVSASDGILGITFRLSAFSRMAAGPVAASWRGQNRCCSCASGHTQRPGAVHVLVAGVKVNRLVGIRIAVLGFGYFVSCSVRGTLMSTPPRVSMIFSNLEIDHDVIVDWNAKVVLYRPLEQRRAAAWILARFAIDVGRIDPVFPVAGIVNWQVARIDIIPAVLLVGIDRDDDESYPSAIPSSCPTGGRCRSSRMLIRSELIVGAAAVVFHIRRCRRG